LFRLLHLRNNVLDRKLLNSVLDMNQASFNIYIYNMSTSG